MLNTVIIEGWPENKNETTEQLRRYFTIRDELSVQDGIIFKVQRCVVLENRRKKIKVKLHAAHMGLQGTLRRAREAVYWPGMNTEVTELIQNCGICASDLINQPQHPRSTLGEDRWR